MKQETNNTKNNEVPVSPDIKRNQNTMDFTDVRDGKSYKTVQIGDQIIMSENLAFRPIIGVYYAYDEKQAKVAKYGYLYDWETAKKIGDNIKGWHLPSKEEWDSVFNVIRTDKIDTVTGSGKIEFNALFGGYLSDIGTFICASERACFWSSSKIDNNHAWGLMIDEHEKESAHTAFDCKCGLSIRLFKDK